MKRSIFGQHVDKVLELNSIDSENNFVSKGDLVKAEFAIRILLPYAITINKEGIIKLQNRENLPLGHVVPACEITKDVFDIKKELNSAHIPGGIRYLYTDANNPWEHVKNFKEYLKQLDGIIECIYE